MSWGNSTSLQSQAGERRAPIELMRKPNLLRVTQLSDRVELDKGLIPTEMLLATMQAPAPNPQKFSRGPASPS